MNPTGKTLIFFDDVCVLCNRLVKRLIEIDKSDQFRFVALNGDFAKQHAFVFDTDAVVVMDVEGQTYFADRAVLFICQQLLSLKWLALVMRIIPVVFRKLLYRWVACNRYCIFGRYDHCPLFENTSSDLRKKIIT